MQDHLPLLRTALEWVEQGRRPWLIHVAQTWGSSPRPAGSLMVLDGQGEHLGSVSGGCVEGDLFQRLAENALQAGHPALIEYGGEHNPHVPLPCRGHLRLVTEPLSSPAQLRPIIDAIEQRRELRRRLDLATGDIDYPQAGTAKAIQLTGNHLEETYGPQWRVLLIGANELSQFVARQCLALGYEVLVCDPREEYRLNWQEQRTELVSGMPDEAAQQWLVDERCALLALTHDPKQDDLALLQALQGPAFYIGALGSRRSADRRRDTLAQMGLSATQVQRLDAPIGLDIGSRSPAEIAVAIAARLIQVRHAMHAVTPLRAVEES